MTRLAARGAAALVLAAAVLSAVGQAQQGVPDKVYLRDKKDGSPRARDGSLKVTPAGYELVPPGSGKPEPVAYPDIVRVVPGDANIPGLTREKDVNPALVMEEKREFDKALLAYQDVKKRLPAPQEKTKRFLDYKIATLTARVADETRYEEGWKEQAEKAVGLLKLFAGAHPGGWEAYPVGSTLARLQGELGLFPDAAGSWSRLAKDTAGVPAPLRQEADLQAVDSLIRAKQYPEAEAKLNDLKDLGGAAKDRAAVYRVMLKAVADPNPAAAADALDAEVAKAKDPAVRGTAYSMLGELYLLGEKPRTRDAMWAFLWVEVVYNHDRDEVIKAMTRLAGIFEADKDEDRAKAYREKIRRYRSAL
jgi:hypothetical protein